MGERKKRVRPGFQYIDLFAGCGGLALGLHNAGWRGLFAIEKDKMAFETLSHNLVSKHKHYDWPEWLPKKHHSINSVLKKYRKELLGLRGAVDLVAGGPPCQGFSMDGRRQEGDRRNRLIHSYIEFIGLVRPRILLFENVKGFTIPFTKGKQVDTVYSEVVLDKLRALGYNVCGRILDFSHYGVPQRRKRFIIVGVKRGKAQLFFDLLETKKSAFLEANGLKSTISAKAAISDLERRHGTSKCPDSKKFDSGVYGPGRTGYQILLRGKKSYRIPNSHRFAKHLERTVKVFKKVLKHGRRNRKINGSAREKFGLKKRSVTVLSPGVISPTLTSIPDDYLHYSEPRILTVRESARLQSFPDWFEFKGKYTTGGNLRAKQVPRYTQVGNAIPPIFSEQAGLALKNF